VICSTCGHRNTQEARFCSNCGNPLQDETTVSLTPVEVEEETAEAAGALQSELESGQALLSVVRGPNAGSTFLIDEDVASVGRHPDSNVFLDDVTVSRRHAELRRGDDGRYVIHDVGSLNGTYVNRRRVEESLLANGDELQIGKFRLTYFVGE
jgi:pSer/pThr/pTyr-binding forkhead associated (FHA) protein